MRMKDVVMAFLTHEDHYGTQSVTDCIHRYEISEETVERDLLALARKLESEYEVSDFNVEEWIASEDKEEFQEFCESIWIDERDIEKIEKFLEG